MTEEQEQLRSAYDKIREDAARLVTDVASLQRRIDQALADSAGHTERIHSLRAEVDRCAHSLSSLRTVLGANLDELDRLFPVTLKTKAGP